MSGSDNKKSGTYPKKRKTNPTKTDLQTLEDLEKKILRKLERDDFKPKVADFLKVLEYKRKLKFDAPEKQKVWDLIEKIRKEELASEDE